MTPRKLALSLGLPLAAATIALPSVAVPAFALSGDYAASGVYIRSGPHTSNTALGLGYPGQGATISCFTEGTNISGNPYWDHNRDQATGVTGYSADYYMSWTGTLYHC
ncbi:MAG: hypothetical protein ABIP57_19580 [Jatrophihabitantaceae bacterium]